MKCLVFSLIAVAALKTNFVNGCVTADIICYVGEKKCKDYRATVNECADVRASIRYTWTNAFSSSFTFDLYDSTLDGSPINVGLSKGYVLTGGNKYEHIEEKSYNVCSKQADIIATSKAKGIKDGNLMCDDDETYQTAIKAVPSDPVVEVTS